MKYNISSSKEYLFKLDNPGNFHLPMMVHYCINYNITPDDVFDLYIHTTDATNTDIESKRLNRIIKEINKLQISPDSLYASVSFNPPLCLKIKQIRSCTPTFRGNLVKMYIDSNGNIQKNRNISYINFRNISLQNIPIANIEEISSYPEENEHIISEGDYSMVDNYNTRKNKKFFVYMKDVKHPVNISDYDFYRDSLMLAATDHTKGCNKSTKSTIFDKQLNIHTKNNLSP